MLTPAPISEPRTDPAEVPNVRLYVIGPNDDPHAGNALLGSYWLATDSFPLATTAESNDLNQTRELNSAGSSSGGGGG